MLDNELIRIFLPIFQNGFLDRGLSVKVRQAYQPTQTGTESTPVCTFFKMTDYRYGHPYKISYYDTTASSIKHTERQIYESTWQINALATQSLSDINSLTAYDIVNYASEIIQSDKTIYELKNAGVGILRVTQVRNFLFSDDRRQYESQPSFDFVLRHAQERTIDAAGITQVVGEIVKIQNII